MTRLTEVFQIAEANMSALKLNPKRVELLKGILMQKVDEFKDDPADVAELESMLKELGVNR